jgi:virginiamycin B lyase
MSLRPIPLVVSTIALGTIAAAFAPAGRARPDPVIRADRTIPSSALLAQLPEGEEKRRFILDCTGCHQLDARTVAPDGVPRSEAGWAEAITRMLGFAGARTGFPVIAHDRDAAATAAWLARHLDAAALERARAVPSLGTSDAEITEYPMPLAGDLPHDVAVDDSGRAIITGMFSHVMYRLDPRTGRLDSVQIPVAGANPRAVEIGRDGSWWILLGGPRTVARYEPGKARWTTVRIGEYPHGIGLDSGGTRGWVNGHFTRSPELIGSLHIATGAVDTVHAPPHPTLADPPGGPIPYELRLGPDGTVWFTELQGNRVIAYDPGTRRFAAHTMPTAWSGPRRFDVDASGVLWIPAYAANSLVRFDPRRGEWREIPLPVRDAVPYVVRVDHADGTVWIGTSAADALLRYTPATGRFTVVPLPSRGALVRHLAIDPRTRDVWVAYGASPGIAARVARVRLR